MISFLTRMLNWENIPTSFTFQMEESEEPLEIQIAKVEKQLMDKLLLRERQRSHRGGRKGTTGRPQIEAPCKSPKRAKKVIEEAPTKTVLPQEPVDSVAKMEIDEKPRRVVIFRHRVPEVQDSRSKGEDSNPPRPTVRSEIRKKAQVSPQRRLKSVDRRPKGEDRRQQNEDRRLRSEERESRRLQDEVRRLRDENRRLLSAERRRKGEQRRNPSVGHREHGRNRSVGRHEQGRNLSVGRREQAQWAVKKETLQENPHWRSTQDGRSECRCLRCFQWGHHRKDCPNPRTYSRRQKAKRAGTAEDSRDPARDASLPP